VTPSPTLRHQALVGRLYFAIESWLRAHKSEGRVFLSPFDVVFSNYDVVEPDLIFIAGDQTDILTEANVQGSPALVIEILSPGTRRRDQGIKRKLFDRAGVREYWLVDPVQHVVTVFRRAGNRQFPPVAVLTAGENTHLATPLMPGLSIALDELFSPTR
jgi:Uma2 family endonuclease